MPRQTICISHWRPGVKISPLLRDHYHHAIIGRVGTVPTAYILPLGAAFWRCSVRKQGLTSGCSIFVFVCHFRSRFFVCFHLRTFYSKRFCLALSSLRLCFAYNIFRTEMSRAGLRSQAERRVLSWAEPWVLSRAWLPSRTESRPDPKHQAEPSEQAWALSQVTSNPESRAPSQSPADEQGPDLSLSRAPIWAEPSIELIPESRA